MAERLEPRLYPYHGGDLPEAQAQIAAIPTAFPHRWRWWWMTIAAAAATVMLLIAIGATFSEGIGLWGNNAPNYWGMAIMNYVWWIGIGNAGTMISALLLLLGRGWRNSLNRMAETMTVFAVACAGLFPIIHLGRPGFVMYVFPYPNTQDLWPQFRSPLFMDVTAVFSYLLVSVIFWYVGLLPDLAAMRDRAPTRRWQVFYGLLALGWRNSARHWDTWWNVYKGCAILAVPLVISVHSGVGLLFAMGPQAGWHTTLFPPFFVIGALYSGFAVVAMLATTLRHAFGLHALVTERHLDILGKVLLATALMTGYGYVMEAFTQWWSGDPFERNTLMDRFVGEYAWLWWTTIVCNLVLIQLLWFKPFRVRPVLLFAMGVVGTVGMWFERYMLLITTTYRPFISAEDGPYVATAWEWMILGGTIGLFLFGYLLFVRLLPMISGFEAKETIAEMARKRGETVGAAGPHSPASGRTMP
ncbi:NrfD/PsrC family molybdoenzyme membrane anchor subunit [Caenispirillum bisanense]|uniref:Prokaryotic molybdopterin-containing oxidoreductase family, membrane subunit n=1 Tax=Caenispirillum bisanense TaxID=414052 RepID=A0A286G078_9PROT|nr:NrfD/PsrC family molybdoenzyme membrane anchor subunit [Caenispirillum bisanense]SOD88930.1 prokaryotic molybdopterin-containing oxidoreductase family, membrane subunit [Caenispirillum bisanense]